MSKHFTIPAVTPSTRQAGVVSHGDDRDDVEAAKRGDTGAFTRLVSRHDDRLRRFVHPLLGNRSDLDDVMQEAYLKAYRSLGSFKGDASFATWLHRIAYNVVIDNARKSSRATPTADLDAGSHREDPTVRIDVLVALRLLPQSQRAIALLVDGHGYDYESVGEILGISSGTVGFHLHRARKRLRSLLSLPVEETQEETHQETGEEVPGEER